jgi:hypothetical protein
MSNSELEASARGSRPQISDWARSGKLAIIAACALSTAYTHPLDPHARAVVKTVST